MINAPPLVFFKINQIDYSQLNSKKVSIVLVTFRKTPKYEMLYESLSHQTIKNFEVVLIEEQYELHKELVKNLSKKFNISTTHVYCESTVPENAKALNEGIVHSTGDYIMNINDCMYFPYRWLEKHLLVASKDFLSLGARYFTYSTNFPIEKYLSGIIEIPKEQDKNISKFLEEKSGIKDYLNIHFGEHIVSSPQDYRLLGLPTDIFKEDNLILEALPGWNYGGNSMAPTEMFLEINGFDERFDNGYGWTDCEIGIRMYNKGHKAFINLSNWSLEIQDKDHVDVIELKADLKDKNKSDNNWKLYEEACDKKLTFVNPNKNLREIKEKNKGK
jgi:glycosyltransferase involved in cell wall biosynthesis